MKALGGHNSMGASLLLAAVLALCAATVQAQAPSPLSDAVATVTVLQGRVDILRDSVPWALSVGDFVKPRQVIVTGPDGFAEFKLADGSTFEIYPNAQVTFRDTPGEWRDLLEVWIGRIKVHIQKLGGQPNHNRVRTPTAVISVRGTIFDVNVEDDGGTTFVMVEEGLVEVSHRLQPGKSVALNPGESVRVYKNQPLARSKIDKGSVASSVARGLAEGLYELMLGHQRAGGSSTPTTGSGTGVGDTKAPNPPPPPPPTTTPPPPPPPPQ